MTKLPSQLTGLRLPVIAAPLFIISNPDLVIAQCKAGIVGSFPALNAREKDGEIGPKHGRATINALQEERNPLCVHLFIVTFCIIIVIMLSSSSSRQISLSRTRSFLSFVAS